MEGAELRSDEVDTPAPQTTSSGRPRFRADIQGLRAVAVLVVVLYHAGLGFSGGFVGVDMFFVVSGFVITGMLMAERAVNGRVRLGRFYLRRIRRLLPALALLLGVVLVASPLVGPLGNANETRQTGIAAALFAANIHLMRTPGYFDLGTEANPLLHLWTLSVEEQFYLAFPWLLLLVWRFHPGRGRRGGVAHRLTSPVVLLSAAGAASFGLAIALTAGWTPIDPNLADNFAFFGSPARAWEFLAGALLALTGARAGRRTATAMGGLGVALVAIAVFTLDGSTTFPGPATLLPVTGTVLLLLAGTDANASTTRVLSWRPAGILGDLSYSWYLWHWPFIVFTKALFPGVGWAVPVAAALSIAPAWLSFTYVENPVRHGIDRGARPTLRLGALCVAVPILAAAFTLPLQQRVEHELEAFNHQVRLHVDATRRCDVHQANPNTRAGCTWYAATSGGRTAVLLGDSNAGHFSEGFIGAARDLDLDAIIQTRSNCPFIDLVTTRDGLEDRDCRRFYDDQMRQVLADRPDVVVIANSTDGYITFDRFLLASSWGSDWQRRPAAKAQLWAEGFTRTLEQLHRAGVQTVVIHPVPKFPSWDSQACASALVLWSPDRCAPSADLADLLVERTSAIEAETAATQAYPSTVAYDPAEALCPRGVCAAFQHPYWWWRDSGHISVHASTTLTAEIRGAMKLAARS